MPPTSEQVTIYLSEVGLYITNRDRETIIYGK